MLLIRIPNAQNKRMKQWIVQYTTGYSLILMQYYDIKNDDTMKKNKYLKKNLNEVPTKTTECSTRPAQHAKN